MRSKLLIALGLALLGTGLGCTNDDGATSSTGPSGSPPTGSPPPEQEGEGGDSQQLPGGPFKDKSIRFEISGTPTEHVLPRRSTCYRGEDEFWSVLSPGTGLEPGEQFIELSIPLTAVLEAWDKGSAATVTFREDQGSTFHWGHVNDEKGGSLSEGVPMEELTVYGDNLHKKDRKDPSHPDAVGGCTASIARPKDGAAYNTVLDVLIECTDVMHTDTRSGSEIVKTAQTVVTKTQCNYTP